MRYKPIFSYCKWMLGFFILLSFASPALGQGFQHRKGWGPMARSMEEWVKQLNLTEEQMTQIQAYQESYRRETLPWRNELMIKRFELREQFLDPRADPNQILAKQREISDLESKIQERTILYQLGIRKSLTPEQMKRMPPGFGFGDFPGPGMMPGRGRGMWRE